MLDEDAAVDRLAAAGTREMVAAARAWLVEHGVPYPTTDEGFDRLSAAVRGEIRSAVDEGLRDAREAKDAGLPQLAGATLAASLRLGGIRAAKKYAGVA